MSVDSVTSVVTSAHLV